jgi:dTDP-4-amino-4,6-dideoxygalactose transaminase
MVYYPAPIHRTTVFQKLWSDWGQEVPLLPEAEAAAREVLAIPVHPYLRDQDRRHIIDTFRAVFGSNQYK